MSKEVSAKTLLVPAKVADIVFNCQYGDVYTHQETSEILFYESKDCWHALHPAFAQVLRNLFSYNCPWYVVYDNFKNEVCVKHGDYLTDEERKYAKAWQRFHGYAIHPSRESWYSIFEILGILPDEDDPFEAIARCPYE